MLHQNQAKMKSRELKPSFEKRFIFYHNFLDNTIGLFGMNNSKVHGQSKMIRANKSAFAVCLFHIYTSTSLTKAKSN